jgi:hypothetical protein
LKEKEQECRIGQMKIKEIKRAERIKQISPMLMPKTGTQNMNGNRESSSSLPAIK